MDFNVKIKTKYPYLEDNLIEDVVNKAKMFYYALKYPCLPLVNEEEHPITSFVEINWVLSACDEIIERLGFSSAIAYRENGLSWSLDNAQISSTLMSLVKPIAGTI